MAGQQRRRSCRASVGRTSTPGGLSRPYVGVTWPGRLTVTEVEGTTIFIFVWARTQQELDAWLPVADGFVGSIHFVPN